MLQSTAQAQNVAKYSNNFLTIGAGARNLGMGNAVTSYIGGAEAGYWNPAGLVSSIDSRQVSIMHAAYFGNIANFDFAAMAQKIDQRTAIAVSVVRLGVDDIPNTLDLVDASGNIDYANLTTFSAADYGFIMSYARQTPNAKTKFGVNTKVIRRTVGPFASAWGFGFDVGIQHQLGKWQLGAVARDITGTYNAWTYNKELLDNVFTMTGNEIPDKNVEITAPRLMLGLGRIFVLKPQLTLQTELDMDITTDGRRNTLISEPKFSIDPYAGAELAYRNTFFLRTGINNIQKQTDFTQRSITKFQPNAGVGFRVNKKIKIDYALTDIGSAQNSYYSHVVSLLIDFGKKQ
jgi:hypothetical protein